MCTKWSFPLSLICINSINPSSFFNSSKICTMLKPNPIHICQVQSSFRMKTEINLLPLVLCLPPLPWEITGFVGFSSFLSLQGSSWERLPALSSLNISLAVKMTVPGAMSLWYEVHQHFSCNAQPADRQLSGSGFFRLATVLLTHPIQTVVWSSS